MKTRLILLSLLLVPSIAAADAIDDRVQLSSAVSAVGEILYDALYCGDAASDADPGRCTLRGAGAFYSAAVNTGGGGLYLAGGSGTVKLTGITNANCAPADFALIKVNGTWGAAQTYGAEWCVGGCANDNAAATSLAATLDALPGVMAVASTNNIYLLADPSTYDMGIGISDVACATPASGTPGPAVLAGGADTTLTIVTAQGTLTYTDGGAAGPVFNCYQDSSSPADADIVCAFNDQGKDSAGNVTSYGYRTVEIQDPANGSEEGIMRLGVMENASLVEYLRLDGTDGIRSLVAGVSLLLDGATYGEIYSTGKDIQIRADTSGHHALGIYLNALNPMLVGASTENGSATDFASNGTAVLTKAVHGVACHIGDLLEIVDATTAGDRGFYRIAGCAAGTITVDRALAGTDADVDIRVFTNVIGLFPKNAALGQVIAGYSSSNKPMQLGGSTQTADGHGLTSEDIFINSDLVVSGGTYLDGGANLGTSDLIVGTNAVCTWDEQGDTCGVRSDDANANSRTINSSDVWPFATTAKVPGNMIVGGGCDSKTANVLHGLAGCGAGVDTVIATYSVAGATPTVTTCTYGTASWCNGGCADDEAAAIALAACLDAGVGIGAAATAGTPCPGGAALASCVGVTRDRGTSCPVLTQNDTTCTVLSQGSDGVIFVQNKTIYDYTHPVIAPISYPASGIVFPHAEIMGFTNGTNCIQIQSNGYVVYDGTNLYLSAANGSIVPSIGGGVVGNINGNSAAGRNSWLASGANAAGEYAWIVGTRDTTTAQTDFAVANDVDGTPSYVFDVDGTGLTRAEATTVTLKYGRLGSATIDTNSAAAQTIFTVPAGKVARVEKVRCADASAALTVVYGGFGGDVNCTDFVGAGSIDLTTITSTNWKEWYVASDAAKSEYPATTAFCFKTTAQEAAADTIVCSAWGHYDF